jgi:uncharacterized protein
MPKRRPEHTPLRTCAVCRGVHPKQSMARLVRRPDGSVTVDPTGKAAGRGTYLCEQPACRDPQRLADGVARALGVRVQPEAIAAEVSHATA